MTHGAFMIRVSTQQSALPDPSRVQTSNPPASIIRHPLVPTGSIKTSRAKRQPFLPPLAARFLIDLSLFARIEFVVAQWPHCQDQPSRLSANVQGLMKQINKHSDRNDTMTNQADHIDAMIGDMIMPTVKLCCRLSTRGR